MLEESEVVLSAPLDDFDTPQVEVRAEVDQANDNGDEMKRLRRSSTMLEWGGPATTRRRRMCA